jgi:hypothetical protein
MRHDGDVIVVYPDSNPLNRNPYLRGRHLEKMLDSLKALDGELLFSPVVLSEIRRQEMDDIAEVQEAVNAVVRKRTRGHQAKMSQIQTRIGRELDAVREEVDAGVAAALANERIVEDDYPDVPVEDLVLRDLERRPPFVYAEVHGSKRKQSFGMRDVVIWEGLRARARHGGAGQTLIFITEDAGFLNEDATGLHEDLLADLDLDGVDRSRVVHVGSIEQANVKLDELRALITSEQAAAANQVIALAMRLSGTAVGWRYDSRDGGLVESELGEMRLPPELEDAQVVAVDIIDDPSVGATRPYEASVTVDLSISGSMWATDWYSIEENTDLELWEDSGRYVEVGTIRRVLVELTFNPDEDPTAADIDALRVRGIDAVAELGGTKGSERTSPGEPQRNALA